MWRLDNPNAAFKQSEISVESDCSSGENTGDTNQLTTASPASTETSVNPGREVMCAHGVLATQSTSSRQAAIENVGHHTHVSPVPAASNPPSCLCKIDFPRAS